MRDIINLPFGFVNTRNHISHSETMKEAEQEDKTEIRFYVLNVDGFFKPWLATGFTIDVLAFYYKNNEIEFRHAEFQFWEDKIDSPARQLRFCRTPR